MPIRLTGWLEEKFVEQLLLGNHWLREKNRRKAQGIKLNAERAWRELYCDNGSCLDITLDFPPGDDTYHRYLQIIELAPFTLSDGQTKVCPRISPDHALHLQTPTSLHAIVAVRKYTIRYTSYGPPRDKLGLVLHAVDWIGHVPALRSPHTGALKPLWTEDIEAVAHQLHKTRVAEDRRCLAPSVVSEAGADTAMAGADDDESQMHSQYAFSTQAQAHPIRGRPSADEPQVLGVKRNEPVLAGNTQREEIRPHAPVVNQKAALLDLLKDASVPKVPTPTPRHEFARPAPNRPTAFPEPKNSQLFSQVPAAAHREPTQTQMQSGSRDRCSGSHQDNDAVASARPAQGTKCTREAEAEAEAVSRRDQDKNSQTPKSSNKTTPRESGPKGLQLLASECSWMKDFKFTRDAFRVDEKQRSVLAKHSSWHKPPPGEIFEDGNVPIDVLTTLHRMVDERAALEGALDSDPEMGEDSSPQDSVEEVNASPDSLPQPTRDSVGLSTQVSWSASPSPEPPKMTGRFDQGLPPDSSAGRREEPTHDDTADKMEIVDKSAPITVDSSNEKEQSVPPSSPPYPQVPIGLEDDMEMEEFVPQGLGEDSVGGASETQEQPGLVSPPAKSIVQVEQTPTVAGKNGHLIIDAAMSLPEKQRSSGTTKNTSLGSIVYGTYNDVREHVEGFTKPILHVPLIEPKDAEGASDAVMADETTMAASDMEQVQEPEQRFTPLPYTDNPAPLRNPTKMAPMTQVRSEIPSKSPSPASITTKRKLDNSPSKRSSRHSKRREIKIVGFGDIAPAAVDPASALRHHREESLRKFREGRRSSATLDSRPQPVTERKVEKDGDVMEVDSRDAVLSNAPSPAMSLRHVSLYEDPSPVVAAESTTMPPLPASMPSRVIPPQQGPPGVSPQSHAHVAGEHQPNFAASIAPTSSIFEAFKAAYPDYTGNAKHLQGQCKQILKLDAEDKMVPKWQWDDYIIRSKMEYSEYLQECNDQGDDPEPYHRFYKDNIRPIYTEGIIEGRGTLSEALRQLGASPPVSRPPDIGASPPVSRPSDIGASSPVSRPQDTVKTVPEREKRSRASLPSAFNRPNASAEKQGQRVRSDRDRPRQSLPATSQTIQHTSDNSAHKTGVPASAQQPTSTRRPNLLSRLSLDGAASPRASSVARDPTESTGDPFRDFLFAQQRMTSHVGSTKVDSRLPWPRNLAVRPSVAEALGRRKIDALSWKDEL